MFVSTSAKMQLKPMEINPEVSVRCMVARGWRERRAEGQPSLGSVSLTAFIFAFFFFFCICFSDAEQSE